jgi:hypothetical protein
MAENDHFRTRLLIAAGYIKLAFRAFKVFDHSTRPHENLQKLKATTENVVHRALGFIVGWLCRSHA